jgi:hypothetical protein
LYEGVSLYDQKRKHNEVVKAKADRLGDRLGSRQYFSLRHTGYVKQPKRKDVLVMKDSITKALRSYCCKRRCLDQFTPDVVESLRYEMHHSDTKFKDNLRLAVHKNYHYVPQTAKKVCVVEGKIVCFSAWRMMYGVSKTDFYRYRGYEAEGRRAQQHGGLGKKKRSRSAAQAVQTMSMILASSADVMPHRTHTPAKGAMKGVKVVEKVLPAGTKWKNILDEVNKVHDVILSPLCCQELIR